MVKNLRKGSKVSLSISGRGLKRTSAIVTDAKYPDYISVKVVSGPFKGKSFSRKSTQLKKK